MLLGMSKKKPGPPADPNSKRSKGGDRHTKPRIVFHVDQDVYDALDEHIRESPVELQLSAVMRRAVKLYLESVGKWPPKKKA